MIAIIAATIAAVLATVGDLLLLAVANGMTSAFGIEGRFAEPALVVGYYLGVFGIPLYALGYWHISRRLPEPYARMVVAFGTCGAVLGSTIHGVTGAAIHARGIAAPVQTAGIEVLLPFSAYLAPLWLIVAAALLGGSVAFALPVARGTSAYPRWIALANPIVLVAVIGGAASVAAWSRALLTPATPNLAHVIFFAVASAYVSPRLTSPHARRGRDAE